MLWEELKKEKNSYLIHLLFFLLGGRGWGEFKKIQL
jgi:hypothetical protein